MESVHDAPRPKGLLSRILTTDFCPWANRFVYWLKEPVGWFVLGTAISVMIGMYASPVGWTVAAALVALIAVGMVWPWIAIRAASCALRPEVEQVHEEDPCFLKLSIKNRLPLPIWGLAVEGFLDQAAERPGANVSGGGAEESLTIPTVALAYVRGWSTCGFRFSIRPALRGRYPSGDTALTCSFPFGIWTAKKTLKEVQPITVWPKVYSITGENPQVGKRVAQVGNGNRPGRSGDFLGIREYRRGDSMRQIHWVATARTGDLVTKELSGPQCTSFDLYLETGNQSSRQAIARRVRIAASLFSNLHESGIAVRLHVGERTIRSRPGRDGWKEVMDELADVPLDGFGERAVKSAKLNVGNAIRIAPADGGASLIEIHRSEQKQRHMPRLEKRTVDFDQDLTHVLASFWDEVRDTNHVA